VIVFLSLGSNIGNRKNYLKKAITAIASLEKNSVVKVSSVYETEPWGNKNQAMFLNQVIAVESELGPLEFLNICKKIEKNLGRAGGGESWGPRTIDIDILLYGNKVINEKAIRVPHPMICDRRFVLVPLAEIAPTAFIPGLGKTVREALSECLDNGEVKLYEKSKRIMSEGGPLE